MSGKARCWEGRGGLQGSTPAAGESMSEHAPGEPAERPGTGAGRKPSAAIIAILAFHGRLRARGPQASRQSLTRHKRFKGEARPQCEVCDGRGMAPLLLQLHAGAGA